MRVVQWGARRMWLLSRHLAFVCDVRLTGSVSSTSVSLILAGGLCANLCGA